MAASPPEAANRPVAKRPVTVDNAGETGFRQEIQPLLKRYCYSCHVGSVKSGNVAFDEIKSYAALRQNRKLFQKVLKNVRSGLMPPAGMEQPAAAAKQSIAQWIKTYVYGIDAANPDPGRVTVRRLNRVEYSNTIHDLIGVDYDTQTEFPTDDAGHGFDNIGDVLTISPMLMEKYLNAAQSIISQAAAAIKMPARSIRRFAAQRPAARGGPLFRSCGPGRSQCSRIARQRLYLSQRASGTVLWSDGRGSERRRIPQGRASFRQPARWYTDHGECAGGDLEPHTDFSGQTRSVYSGQHSGRSGPAP